MNALDTSSDSSSALDAAQRFAAVRMPIEEPVDDLNDAVRKLRQCSSTELRRARRHHRRAIESLQQGGYNALSASTRDHLLNRLRRNLKALNHALDATTTSESQPPSDADGDGESFSSRLRAFVQGLW
jgi:hypothetical protein